MVPTLHSPSSLLNYLGARSVLVSCFRIKFGHGNLGTAGTSAFFKNFDQMKSIISCYFPYFCDKCFWVPNSYLIIMSPQLQGVFRNTPGNFNPYFIFSYYRGFDRAGASCFYPHSAIPGSFLITSAALPLSPYHAEDFNALRKR